MTDTTLDIVTVAIAVVAIIVSVFTSRASRVSAQATADRQQSFELRFYRLTMLDPAKGQLRRILADSDRRLNSIVLRRDAAPEDLEELAKLDREAVDTFHAISHHLPQNRRHEIDALRARLEQKWMQQRLDPQFPQDSNGYMKTLLQVVEDRLQKLLTTDA